MSQEDICISGENPASVRRNIEIFRRAVRGLPARLAYAKRFGQADEIRIFYETSGSFCFITAVRIETSS